MRVEELRRVPRGLRAKDPRGGGLAELVEGQRDVAVQVVVVERRVVAGAGIVVDDAAEEADAEALVRLGEEQERVPHLVEELHAGDDEQARGHAELVGARAEPEQPQHVAEQRPRDAPPDGEGRHEAVDHVLVLVGEDRVEGRDAETASRAGRHRPLHDLASVTPPFKQVLIWRIFLSRDIAGVVAAGVVDGVVDFGVVVFTVMGHLPRAPLRPQVANWTWGGGECSSVGGAQASPGVGLDATQGPSTGVTARGEKRQGTTPREDGALGAKPRAWTGTLHQRSDASLVTVSSASVASSASDVAMRAHSAPVTPPRGKAVSA